MRMAQRIAPGKTDTAPGSVRNRDPLVGEIERRTLPPVGRQSRGSLSSGFADNLWDGISASALEQLLLNLTLPSRSPVLQNLLVRALLSDVSLPEDARARPEHFLALRLEMLRRSGRLEDIVQLTESRTPQNRQSTMQAYYAYALLGLGDRQRACGEANAIAVSAASMPRRTLGLSLALVAYCAAADGQFEAAQLNLELARDQGLDVTIAENGLANIAVGTKSRMSQKGRIHLPGYVFLRLADWKPTRSVFKHAGPDTLIAIAQDGGLDERLRLEALESAARSNVAHHATLASGYKRQRFDPVLFNQPLRNRFEGAHRRAFLFQALTREREPLRRLRLVKTFLETARREELYRVLSRMIAGSIASLPLSEDLLGFSGILVEANAAAGDYQRAAEWALLTSSASIAQNEAFSYWLSLLEIAQSDGRARADRDLQLATRNALAGRFRADVLHRLVTVLDALQYSIPIPLWDTASQTAQPSQGHLPETGALSLLQEAAKRGEVGKTLLLAMAALGPDGPEGAHMIALGDTIRALKTVGFEAEARQVGFEALFAIWPRQASH